MTYTTKDFDRAHATLFGEGMYEQRIAQLIADVRRETIEQCARVVVEQAAFQFDALKLARLISALLDEPKAESHRPQVVTITPAEAASVLVARLNAAEPLCKVCRCAQSGVFHTLGNPHHHDFEPEEPGHDEERIERESEEDYNRRGSEEPGHG